MARETWNTGAFAVPGDKAQMGSKSEKNLTSLLFYISIFQHCVPNH